MERFCDIPCDPAQLSALNLAFVGDTVFDLFVRETLVCEANRPVHLQHDRAAARVKAAAQAAAAKTLLPALTEKELEQFRRGRNAHANHKAKNATESDYHYATGLETLFGYLYLNGEIDRLRALMRLLDETKGDDTR